jgi:hypothetical protein
MRLKIAIFALLVATPALAEEGQPAARYGMTPIEGGALRLDTLTGAVDRCAAEAGIWSCRSLPDEGRALQDEIDRLAAENAELRAKLAVSGANGSGSGAIDSEEPTASFNLPSEAEVDKAMSFMERVLKRFKSMVDGLRNDDEKGTAL